MSAKFDLLLRPIFALVDAGGRVGPNALKVDTSGPHERILRAIWLLETSGGVHFRPNTSLRTASVRGVSGAPAPSLELKIMRTD